MEEYLKRVYRWTKEHTSVEEVTDITTDENGSVSFTAIFRVSLPSRFVDSGKTRKGVRSLEPVTFIFTNIFPFDAPLILLRDDFPRDFPHINPNNKYVSPCVFEGNLSELLQQPRWFDGVLDQVADWLTKAASDSLMNMSQGWEPMRTDEFHGFLLNDWESLGKKFNDGIENDRFYAAHLHTGKNHIAVVHDYFHDQINKKRVPRNKSGKTAGVIVSTPKGTISERYLPCQVKDLNDLLRLGDIFEIPSLEQKITQLQRELNNAGKKIMFVVLAIQRPVPLIDKPYSSEFISFALSWLIKKKKKGEKRIKYSAEVLSNRDICTSELLQRFSGTGIGDKHITLIGCGSLGSKIGMHLARGGQKSLSLIDNGWLAPHNNSRHALTTQLFGDMKVSALAKEMKHLRVNVEASNNNAKQDISTIPDQSIVVDTTASQSVRSSLVSKCPGERIIHCALYKNATYGLICLEGEQHNPRVDDLVLTQLYSALDDRKLHTVLFQDEGQRTSTGQGCGSWTVIAPDTRLSLFSSAMASRIRQQAENPSDFGIILMGESTNDMSLVWNELSVKPSVCISGVFDGSWDVRVLESAASKMESETEFDAPNETGGVLVGHVSYTNQCMTIVDVLPAPPDSIKEPCLFILGTEGLKKNIHHLEQMSNGKFTYLGTWHSHPGGGKQSKTDEKTLMRITFLRSYEPTICLIWTPSGIIPVT